MTCRIVQERAAEVDRWLQKVNRISGGNKTLASTISSASSSTMVDNARSTKRRKLASDEELAVGAEGEEGEDNAAASGAGAGANSSSSTDAVVSSNVGSADSSSSSTSGSAVMVPLSQIDKLIAQAEIFGLNLNEEIDGLLQVK